MGFWKFSPFLAIGILALYHVGILQAAPFRSASEKPLELATLTDDEVCLLLTAMLNDYVKLKVHELKQEQETEGFRSASVKPLGPATLTEDEVCLLLTAMLNDYVKLKVHELKQEQETEGSRIAAQESPCNAAPSVTNPLEDLLVRAERMMKNNFVLTSVDLKAIGLRHEELGD